MSKFVFAILSLFFCTGCASFWDLFKRHDDIAIDVPAPVQVDNSPKRTTRKSLEEQSMLGEASGSLWVGRGQSSYLFVNNNQRLLGDILNIRLEGYPKEQIQTKANTIAKLLAEILQERRQEIKLKQDDLKKQIDTPVVPEEGPNFLMRGLASVGIGGSEKPAVVAPADPKDLLKQADKDLKKVNDEDEEIKGLQKANEFPIKAVVARVTEIQKDGNYRIKGEHPFMIGKREYKLLVMGTVRAEEWEEKGISAEVLLDPVFDIISEKKLESGDL